MKRASYNWKLPAAIEARLGHESYGSQRIIQEAGQLLLILHQPPGDSLMEREAAVFLRQPDGRWLYQGNAQGEHALGQLLDGYRAALAALEAGLEKAAGADALFHILDRGIPLARAAGNMKEALQAAREAERQDAFLITCRDRAVDIARALELLLANARLALDYQLARQAEAQVQATLESQQAQYKLNILAAWTLPLMTVATLFGMNLKSGLEFTPAFVFWGIFLAGLGLGLMARGWVSPAKTGRPAQGAGKPLGKKTSPGKGSKGLGRSPGSR